MDFEKEMQKYLRIIRQNIQALNRRYKTPIVLNDSQGRVKRWPYQFMEPLPNLYNSKVLTLAKNGVLVSKNED